MKKYSITLLLLIASVISSYLIWSDNICNRETFLFKVLMQLSFINLYLPNALEDFLDKE